MKKTLITTLTLAILAATPALAQTNTTTTDQPNRTRAHVTHMRSMGPVDDYGQAINDPNAVVIGNQVVGRDPDPFIRLQIKRDPIVNDN